MKMNETMPLESTSGIVFFVENNIFVIGLCVGGRKAAWRVVNG